MSRVWQKILFFALLYFIQGAALAYVVNFQKPYLAERGVDKATLGLFTSFLLLPFILKVGLGMISDRFPLGSWGSRKPYMALGLGGFALSYFLLSGIDPSQSFGVFAMFSFLASLSLALFDTCADGWAIDIARDEEQSSIQAAMVGGKSLGYILMSWSFGRLAVEYGFAPVFQILALMALGVLLVVLFSRYQPLGGQLETSSGSWSEFRELWTLSYALFGIYGVLYSISSFGADGLITLHLSEVRLMSAMELGRFGTCRGLGALLGAYAFARLSQRLPRNACLFIGLIFLSMGCLLPLADLSVPISGVLWGMAWGYQETAFVTVAMTLSRGHWAATFFAISMIFSNLGTALGEAVAAPGAAHYGYPVVFMGLAAVALTATGPLLYRSFSRERSSSLSAM